VTTRPRQTAQVFGPVTVSETPTLADIGQLASSIHIDCFAAASCHLATDLGGRHLMKLPSRI